MARKQTATDVAAEQLAREQAEVEQAFLKGVSTLRDLIAPRSTPRTFGWAQSMVKRFMSMGIPVKSILVG